MITSRRAAAAWLTLTGWPSGPTAISTWGARATTTRSTIRHRERGPLHRLALDAVRRAGHGELRHRRRHGRRRHQLHGHQRHAHLRPRRHHRDDPRADPRQRQPDHSPDLHAQSLQSPGGHALARPGHGHDRSPATQAAKFYVVNDATPSLGGTNTAYKYQASGTGKRPTASA